MYPWSVFFRTESGLAKNLNESVLAIAIWASDELVKQKSKDGIRKNFMFDLFVLFNTAHFLNQLTQMKSSIWEPEISEWKFTYWQLERSKC